MGHISAFEKATDSYTRQRIRNFSSSTVFSTDIDLMQGFSILKFRVQTRTHYRVIATVDVGLMWPVCQVHVIYRLYIGLDSTPPSGVPWSRADCKTLQAWLYRYMCLRTDWRHFYSSLFCRLTQRLELHSLCVFLLFGEVKVVWGEGIRHRSCLLITLKHY